MVPRRTATLAANAPVWVFSGTAAEDVTIWVADAKRALVAANLDAATEQDDAKRALLDRRAAAALVGALDGAALNAARLLSDADLIKPSVLFEHLVGIFGTVATVHAAYAALHAYERPATSSTAEVYASVLVLCKKANPDMAASEKLVHFLRALGDVGKHVVSQGYPASLDAALKSARAIEAAGMGGGTSHRPVAAASAQAAPAPKGVVGAIHQSAPLMFPAPVSGVSSEVGTSSEVDRLIAAVGHLVQTQTARAAPRGGRGGRRGRGPRTALPNNWAANGQPICNTCGETGHMHRECPLVASSSSASSATGGRPFRA